MTVFVSLAWPPWKVEIDNENVSMSNWHVAMWVRVGLWFFPSFVLVFMVLVMIVKVPVVEALVRMVKLGVPNSRLHLPGHADRYGRKNGKDQERRGHSPAGCDPTSEWIGNQPAGV